MLLSASALDVERGAVPDDVEDEWVEVKELVLVSEGKTGLDSVEVRTTVVGWAAAPVVTWDRTVVRRGTTTGLLDEDVVEVVLVEVVDGDAAGAGAATEVGACCVTGGMLVVLRTVKGLLVVVVEDPATKEKDVGVRGETVMMVRVSYRADQRRTDLSRCLQPWSERFYL